MVCVSYASLVLLQKLPVGRRISYKELERLTGRTISSLRMYIEGDWVKLNLVEKGKIGREAYITRLRDGDADSMVKELKSAHKGIHIISIYTKPLED